MKRVAILGGGIIGLCIAYKLLRTKNKIDLTIFEKDKKVGMHQSSRNSGVLHCGLYYTPGSLKARLAVSGIREMTEFCKQHNVDHDICGKIVVASNEQEAVTLDMLYQRGIRNGLTGLRFLDNSELKEREPYVKAFKALLVPEEGITDYKGVMNVLLDEIINAGGGITYEADLTLDNAFNIYDISSYDYVINCTGLNSDKVYNNLTGNRRPFKIVPFRGEYYELTPEANEIVNHLVYPVPDPKFPFLGVHFTRMIDGRKEVGPNAVLAFKREGYNLLDFSFKDATDSLLYSGLYKFILANFKFSMKEFQSSIFKNSFLEKTRKLIPDISANDLIKGSAGVRAQAMSPEGELIMDFKIEKQDNQIHVLNAPSPGATASLAIASYVLENYASELVS